MPMARRVLRYESDEGREAFAIYSTVIDDFVATGLTAQEVIDTYAERQRQKAAERMAERLDALREGRNPYRSWDPEEMREFLEWRSNHTGDYMAFVRDAGGDRR